MTLTYLHVDLELWHNCSWQVGDIVRVNANEGIPCDMVMISSEDPDGSCYITTANLDGETNLKVSDLKLIDWEKKYTDLKGTISDKWLDCRVCTATSSNTACPVAGVILVSLMQLNCSPSGNKVNNPFTLRLLMWCNPTFHWGWRWCAVLSYTNLLLIRILCGFKGIVEMQLDHLSLQGACNLLMSQATAQELPGTVQSSTQMLYL